MSKTYIARITAKKPLSVIHEPFDYTLPFVLPDNLEPNPYISGEGKKKYTINYKLKQLVDNIPNLQRNTPIAHGVNINFNIDDNILLDKYSFVLYDAHCNGTSTEYLISFDLV